MSNFDKIVRKKLQEAEAPYPADMWQRIHSNLPQKKRKAYPLWMLALTIMLISVTAMGLYFAGQNSPAVAPEQQNSPANNVLASRYPANKKQGVLTNEYAVNLGNLNSGEVVNKKDEDFIVKNTGNVLNNKKQSRQISLADVPAGIKESKIESDLLQGEMTSNVNQYRVAASSDNEDVINGAQRLIRRNEKIGAPVIATFLKVFGTDQSDVIESINNSMKRHMVSHCPTFVKKQSSHFIELYFSNDFPIRYLESKTTEAEGYKSLREKTESSFLSYSTGFRVGMGWKNGIALKTGLNYSGINEKLVYTDPNSMQIKTITTVKYVYDDQFNVIDSIKTTENVSIPGSNTVTNYNRISMFDIPVLFQFTVQDKRRLSYSVTGGPVVNLSLTQSGRILDAREDKLINIEQENIYNKNVGVTFYAGVGVNYQLTNKIQMCIEPNVRFMPSSITVNNQPLEQKYFITSLAAALRYKI